MQIVQASIEQLDDTAFLFNEYRVFYGQNSNLEKAKKFVEARLLQQDATIFIAMDNTIPVGYTQLFPSWSSVSMQRVWILNDLFVLPRHRNQGIGKMLLNGARQYAFDTNAVRIILATQTSNAIARNLYESIGYRQFNEFTHYILTISSDEKS